MRRRLLGLCVLSYPRSRRHADGAYLYELALEFAEIDGFARQIRSLLLGGLRERAMLRRRGRPGKANRSLVITTALAALASVGVLALAGQAEVEVEEYAAVALTNPPASRTNAGSVGFTDPAIARFLETTIPETSSGTLVAARDGEIVHCAGFGMADRESGVAATCDTAYDVMSMTKQFTASAILKLEMMGKLEVDDPITVFFAGVPPDKRGITVHQLLTHTSGLVEALGNDYEPLSRDAMVSSAFASRLLAPPGARYHYSNVGYSLLAAIIEKVSGSGYEDFLAQHLFRPAGMTDTGYRLPEWDHGQVAIEYDAHGRRQGRPFEHPWGTDGPYWNLRGNGGLLSTGRDMFRWHVALEGNDILNRSAKAKLFEPYVREEPGGDSFYGYGWAIQETAFGTIAAHDGGNSWSYGEVLRLLDKHMMVFWITNQAEDASSRVDLLRLAPAVTRGVVLRLLRG